MRGHFAQSDSYVKLLYKSQELHSYSKTVVESSHEVVRNQLLQESAVIITVKATFSSY